MNFSAKVIIPDGVLFREIQGEAVLLNLDSENYFGLDSVGTRFWQVLTNSQTIADAYEILLTEYDVSPEVLMSDINELVSNLVSRGLLEVVND
jgi:hypothetical protein